MEKKHTWSRIYTLPTKREAQKSASSLKRASKRPVMTKRIKADAYWRSRGQEWRWAVYRLDVLTTKTAKKGTIPSTRKERKRISRQTPRITPRTPRLRR